MVILATGSTPKVFSLGDDEHVYTAAQVLMKEKDPGQNVAVIGGGLVGCETALWLAQQGRNVKIIEALTGYWLSTGRCVMPTARCWNV